MSRLLRPFLVMIAVSFFVSVSYAAAKKPASQGGGGAKVTTEMCKITGDVSNAGEVAVGIDVKTYGPSIQLTLYPSLFGVYEGTYWGVARVLKKDGRLDFFFDPSGTKSDCVARKDGSTSSACQYRLILLDGTYDRKADTVFFSESARVYLYNYPDGMLFGGEPRTMDVGESVTVDFKPYDE